MTSEAGKWILHYKSNLGSFMEEEYDTLGEMYEAMALLFAEYKIISFRIRYVTPTENPFL